MEAGKYYRVLVAFTYDIYEEKVKCIKKNAKSYRIKILATGDVKLIRMSNLVEAVEITAI